MVIIYTCIIQTFLDKSRDCGEDGERPLRQAATSEHSTRNLLPEVVKGYCPTHLVK